MMSISSLRHRAGAVHHQVGVGQAAVDLLDEVHLQHVAGGLLGELVGAVAGADGDGQGVAAGVGDEVLGLVRVGQVRQGLVAAQAGAVAVLDAAQAADLALDGHAQGVGLLHDLPGDLDVVLVGGRRLAVLHQRAVHHHRGEALLDGAEAGRRAVAVVLVHGDGDLRVQLGGGQHQVAQVVVVGVGAGAAAGLDDDRAVGLGGGHHDGLDLLHVVDVEGADAVVVLGGVVEQDAHGDQWHGRLLRGRIIGRSGPVARSLSITKRPSQGRGRTRAACRHSRLRPAPARYHGAGSQPGGFPVPIAALQPMTTCRCRGSCWPWALLAARRLARRGAVRPRRLPCGWSSASCPRRGWSSRSAATEVDGDACWSARDNPRRTYAPTPRQMAGLQERRRLFSAGVPFERGLLPRMSAMPRAPRTGPRRRPSPTATAPTAMNRTRTPGSTRAGGCVRRHGLPRPVPDCGRTKRPGSPADAIS